MFYLSEFICIKMGSAILFKSLFVLSYEPFIRVQIHPRNKFFFFNLIFHVYRAVSWYYSKEDTWYYHWEWCATFQRQACLLMKNFRARLRMQILSSVRVKWVCFTLRIKYNYSFDDISFALYSVNSVQLRFLTSNIYLLLHFYVMYHSFHVWLQLAMDWL